MPGRPHSREFKLDIFEHIKRNQRTTAQVCREHQLAPSLIYRWRKALETRGVAAFTNETMADQA